MRRAFECTPALLRPKHFGGGDWFPTPARCAWPYNPHIRKQTMRHNEDMNSGAGADKMKPRILHTNEAEAGAEEQESAATSSSDGEGSDEES